MMLKIYLWIMGWSGAINAWAWQRSVYYLRKIQGEKKQ